MVVQSLAVDVRSTEGAQGWNIDYLALASPSCKYWSFGTEESSRLVAVPGTLLGPEGSGFLPAFRIGKPVFGPCPAGRTSASRRQAPHVGEVPPAF